MHNQDFTNFYNCVAHKCFLSAYLNKNCLKKLKWVILLCYECVRKPVKLESNSYANKITYNVELV